MGWHHAPRPTGGPPIPPAPDARWRWLAPVLVYAGILGMSSLPGSRLEPLGLASWVAYVGHATEYGTLGAALAWAAAGTGWARRSRAATVVLVGLGGGALDELYQSTVPGRTPSLLDLTVDVVAVTLAAGLVTQWVRRRERGGARPAPRP